MTIDTPTRPVATEDALDALADTDLFAECDRASLEAVARCIDRETVVDEGAVMCQEGDAATTWWVVTAGTADVTVGGRFVGTIGAGEAIGEIAHLLDGARTATVTATSPLVALEVDGTRFAEVVDWTAGVAAALLRAIARRLKATNEVVGGTGTSRDVGPPAMAAATPAGEPVHWDPSAPGYYEDPYPRLDAIREQTPVYRNDRTQAFMLTRYEHIRQVSRDRVNTVEIARATPTPTVQAEIDLRARQGHGSRSILRLDGDDHTRLRKLVSRAFTPRAIAQWRSRTESIVAALLDEMAERGRFDVVHDYATIVPCQVISEMLGMPMGDIPQIRAWSTAMVKVLDPINTPEEQQAAVDATEGMYGYVSAIIDDKRDHPADDILTALIQAEEDGDRLDHTELVDQVVLLYVAGHETTINLIANGVGLLLDHPDQRRVLLGDPSLDANLVEEVLRFDPVVLFGRRIATADLMFDGHRVPAGAVLSLCFASGNRDPRHWGPTAGEFDILRPGAHEHLTFGGGAHYCLGQALARMEGQAGLPTLMRRFPDLVPDGDAVHLPRVVFRALETLPVSVS